MGCFNITGFHTQLPICYGDKVFGIIGVYKKQDKRKEFSTGRIFTPIALPIFGEYDDYGTIENIEKDDNTKLIETITNVSIEEFIKIIDNYHVHRYSCEEPYQNILNKLKPYIKKDNIIYKEYSSFNEKEDYITFIMDHQFFYKECIKSMRIDDAKKDFEQWCEETEKLKKDIIDRELEFEDFKHLNNKEISDLIENLLINSPFVRDYDKTSLDPNIRNGHFFEHNYTVNELFMSLYKLKNSHLLFDELKTNYCNFITFFRCFEEHSWLFDIHNYCNQQDCIESLLPIYKAMVKHIKNTIKKRKENGWYE